MSPLQPVPLATEHALLGFLRAGPLHGYELHRRLADPAGLGQVWRLKQAHLYALLARLEAEGYVLSRREPQAARPARKVFRLTPLGRRAYRRWLQSPVAHGRELRLEFLAKLFCAQQEGPEAAARLIARQREALQGWLATLRARASRLPEPPAFPWLVEQFRLGQVQAMLAWLDQCEQQVLAPRPPRPGAP